MKSAKSFSISKQVVMDAWRKVKKNKGSYGVDGESIELFEARLHDNLYRIWNRMSSGSYMPPAVMGVDIPKKSGGHRTLGIPTVSDRVAQMVVKDHLERLLEPHFHIDSYGYRPNKSALDAVSITRKRCWKHPWLVEFDIKGLFDNIDHELLLKALRHHCKETWILLYVERWLKVPMVRAGETIPRERGTPQGGVVSPLLANLFMHYGLDKWVERELTGVKFCRYGDDGVLHCQSLDQAEFVMDRLTKRMKEIGLEIHPDKSKIVYCREEGRREKFKNCSFDFLGFRFKPRLARRKDGKVFLAFLPGVNPDAATAMRQTIRKWKLHRRVSLSIEEIAERINPVLRGWANYYGQFNGSSLRPIWESLNRHLAKWLRWKYKKQKRHKTNSIHRLGQIAAMNQRLFVHWRLNCKPPAG